LRGRWQGGGEELPGQQAGIDYENIRGVALRRDLGQLTEDDGENHHGKEGLQQCPGQTDDGLFVAHRDIALGEDEEDLAVAPEVTPIVALGEAGFDHEAMGRHPGVGGW
jgi:hypothetical protein